MGDLGDEFLGEWWGGPPIRKVKETRRNVVKTTPFVKYILHFWLEGFNDFWAFFAYWHCQKWLFLGVFWVFFAVFDIGGKLCCS